VDATCLFSDPDARRAVHVTYVKLMVVMAAVAEPPPDIRTCGPYARCTYRGAQPPVVNVAI
jgi:hypothetical protein